MVLCIAGQASRSRQQSDSCSLKENQRCHVRTDVHEGQHEHRGHNFQSYRPAAGVGV